MVRGGRRQHVERQQAAPERQLRGIGATQEVGQEHVGGNNVSDGSKPAKCSLLGAACCACCGTFRLACPSKYAGEEEVDARREGDGGSLQQRVQDCNAGARDFRVGVSQPFSDSVHGTLHLKWCGSTLGEQVVEGEKRRLAMRPGRRRDCQRLQLRGDFFVGSSVLLWA